jgi:hypothetical protein
MAIVSNPLIGRTRKSTGNVTFSNWKGINVLKNKATVVANPQTPAQLVRRSAFTQVVSMFRANAAAINIGFKSLAVRKSAFNAFASNALKNAFDYSTPPNAVMNSNLISFSQGTMTPTSGVASNASISNGTGKINYNAANTGPGQSLTDKIVVIARNLTQTALASVTTMDAATRTDGSVSADIPSGSAVGDLIQFIFFFHNTSTGNSSDSEYSDELAVA